VSTKPKNRRALREILVKVPAWAEGETRLREPSVRVYLAASKIEDEQERTVILLGDMVLDDEGNPVGRDAILDAPVVALAQLSGHIPGLLGVEASPLDPPKGSATASP
jgi:hypothetical protein